MKLKTSTFPKGFVAPFEKHKKVIALAPICLSFLPHVVFCYTQCSGMSFHIADMVRLFYWQELMTSQNCHITPLQTFCFRSVQCSRADEKLQMSSTTMVGHALCCRHHNVSHFMSFWWCNYHKRAGGPIWLVRGINSEHIADCQKFREAIWEHIWAKFDIEIAI